MKKLKMVLLILSLCFCLSSCSSWQSTDQTVTTGAASRVSQDATQTEAGSTAQAESIGKVITENNEGIPIAWFLPIVLVIGILIPQPKFVRVIMGG